MTRRRVLFAVFLASTLLAVPYLLNRSLEPWLTTPWWIARHVVGYLVVPGSVGMGALIVSRHPRNAVGWILLVFGVSRVVGYYTLMLANVFARGAGPEATRVGVVVWVGALLLSAPYLAFSSFLFLLFPDGSLPSRRWRVVALIAGLVAALRLASNLFVPSQQNPFAIRAFAVLGSRLSVQGREVGISSLLTALAAGLCVAALVARVARSTGNERRQLRSVAVAGSIFAAAYLCCVTGGLTAPSYGLSLTTNLVVNTAIALVPFACAFVIFRYRLYAIDLVLSRTLLVGMLAAFVTASYVIVTVASTRIAGTRAPSSLVAMCAVAVSFSPVRRRTQRLAERLVFGERAEAYEVLAGFAREAATSLELEDVIPRIARAAGRGVAARSVVVRLDLPDGTIHSETWPDGAAASDPDFGVDVAYRDQPIGRIEVTKRRGDPVSSEDRRLLTLLARQAGAALQNVRLALELEERLLEVERLRTQTGQSNRRLVAAQMTVRRALESEVRRNVGVHLDRVDVLLAGSSLAQAADTADVALRELRMIAHGVYSPVLEERGLVAALESVAPSARIAASTRRFDPSVERAVYFCCARVVANTRLPLDVRVGEHDGHVAFEIAYADEGFNPLADVDAARLQEIADRAAALGGSVEMSYTPGGGGALRGRIPAAGAPPLVAVG